MPTAVAQRMDVATFAGFEDDRQMDLTNVSEDVLPTYEEIANEESERLPSYGAGPIHCSYERMHLKILPSSSSVSTYLIRRPWTSQNSPICITTPEEGEMEETPAPAPPVEETPVKPRRNDSTSSASSENSQSTREPVLNEVFRATYDDRTGQNFTLASTDNPDMARVMFPVSKLSPTVRIRFSSRSEYEVMPFEMKMARIDYNTRSHEFKTADGRVYQWRYDMVVGSSMSLYCMSGGLSVKGILVATMERAGSLIESFVKNDRKLKIDKDWIDEQFVLATALIMLQRETSPKRNGVS